MKIANLVNTVCLVAALALDCSASHAADNGGIFLSGQYDGNVGFDNCTGSCSAGSNGTVAIGITSKTFSEPHSEWQPDRASASLEYSRSQYTHNGNAITVRRPAINWNIEWDLGEHSGFSVAMGILALGWQITDGANLPSRTTFDPSANLYLFYAVSPALQLSLGYNHKFIYASGNPDFIANSVGFGLRWYP